jgi:hypothetical protein
VDFAAAVFKLARVDGAHYGAMKMELINVSRRPVWPYWAVLIVLVWFALGTGSLSLASYLDQPVQLCLLKRLTGFPCPTCGFTRGALAFLHGHVLQGWLYNPLLYSVLALFSAVVVVRVIFGRAMRVSLTPAERRAAWILALTLFFVNWAYVVLRVG